MIKTIQHICLLCVLALFSCQSSKNVNTTPKPSTSNSAIQQKVKDLLATMTLEDKVGEMTQLSLDMVSVGQPYNLEDPIRLDTAKMRHVLVDLKVGSILNNGGHALTLDQWHTIIPAIQKMATEEKSTGIPVIYGIDAIHGTNYTVGATLYPQEIGLAATFNPAMAKELAVISAYETKASAIPWSFAPVLDIGRDPRWSRFWETFGEDPMLASAMSTALFEGYQGDDISAPNKVVACMKHFVGYSMPLSGKDRTPAWIPERQLRQYFLPSFKAAIDAGAKTVMINSGEINGIPVHADPKLLNDLLRDELGFNGVAVTDWEDVKYLYTRHRVAKDYKDATKIAINAGIDMAMVPVDLEFTKYLKELVEEGEVPMSRIDEAVTRILTLKFELGLFETTFQPKENYPDFGSEKFRKKSLEATLESITLLKNDKNLLPLSGKQKILITGPTAHSLNALNGAWTGTWQGVDAKYNTKGKSTIYEALQAQIGADNVNYVAGSDFEKAIDINKAVAAARKSDVAIICLGESPYTEKPGDIDDLNLPKAQLELVEAIAKTGTPIILVMVEGRPRIIRTIEPLSQAIVMAYLPSDEGGIAIAQTLFGENNPNGKLPFTYPRFANDLLTYDYKGTETISRNFGTDAVNPQWAFGFGLSYTNFEYKNLKVASTEKGKYSISVDVTNTGNQAGKETILLFVRDKVASITPPEKELKAFTKVNLKAGETKTHTFSLTAEDLKFVGVDNKWIIEAGEFEAMIGNLKEVFNY